MEDAGANNNDEEEVRVGGLLFWGLIGGWSFGGTLNTNLLKNRNNGLRVKSHRKRCFSQ